VTPIEYAVVGFCLALAGAFLLIGMTIR